MANNSIYAAFQQMWLHVTNALGAKADTAVLDTKVDKVAGKGLSTNDYTTADKTALNAIPDTYATKSEVPTIEIVRW